MSTTPHKGTGVMNTKRFDLYMSGNDMRNVELPVILTSLVLDYTYNISSATGRRLRDMEVNCSHDVSQEPQIICIIKRVK